jgi:hypothetical protein
MRLPGRKAAELVVNMLVLPGVVRIQFTRNVKVLRPSLTVSPG